MSFVLIAYGTTDGHTARIVAAAAEALRKAGVRVDVRTGQDSLTAWLLPADYDAVIVAASIHASGFQWEIQKWATFHHDALNAMPTLFLPVCLSTLQPEPAVQAELQQIIDTFVKKTGWKPGVTHAVAGALAYRRYGWFKRLIMKRIARRAGGDTDTSRDWVYTDWKDLDHTVLAFGESLEPAFSGAGTG
jgi:menaquinone-dependent protoporphyrinogen oxidase